MEILNMIEINLVLVRKKRNGTYVKIRCRYNDVV